MVQAQYIVDGKGNRISVILPVKDYEKMLEMMEELEDIRMYDEVKAKNEGSILLEDYIESRNLKHAWLYIVYLKRRKSNWINCHELLLLKL